MIQVNRIRNEQGANTIDSKEIQKVINEYFKTKPLSIKMKNLKEMDEFLHSFKPPKLNQEEINNLNKPTTNEKILVEIKRFPKEKNLCLR